MRILSVLALVVGCGDGSGGSSSPEPVSTASPSSSPSPTAAPRPTPIPSGPPWAYLGPDAGQTTLVALDAGADGVAYACSGIPCNTVVVSEDHGDTWCRTVLAVQAPGYVEALAVDPDTGFVYASTTIGAWRSRDRGQTWESIGDLPNFLSLATTRAESGRVYVSGEDGLYRSDDGGSSWRQLRGDPSWPVAVDPADPNRVLLGSSVDVLLSLDGGEHFEALGPPFEMTELASSVVSDVEFARSDPSILFAIGVSLFRSGNGGLDWELRAPELDFTEIPRQVEVDPSDASFVHFMAGPSYYRSEDGGLTWRVARNVVDPWFYTTGSLAVDEREPSRLYLAVSPGGVFRSEDRGETWGRLTQGFGPANVVSVEVDPHSPGRLYAGTATDGLFVSNDSGTTWEDLSVRAGVSSSAPLFVDPTTPGLAVLRGSGTSGGVLTQKATIRTLNGGESWQRVSGLRGPQDVAFDRSIPGRLLLVNGELFESRDSGETFRKVEVGTAEDGSCVSFEGVAVDSVSADLIYLHTGARLYRSTDAGRTWEPPPAPPECNEEPAPAAVRLTGFTGRVVAHPTREGVAFANSPSGVLRTTDGGQTWEQTDEQLGIVHDLDFDPTDGETLYAATDFGRLFRSENQGRTWWPVGPAAAGPLLDVSIAPGGGTVYAAVAGFGVGALSLP